MRCTSSLSATIYTLDGGRVAEQGTYQELITRGVSSHGSTRSLGAPPGRSPRRISSRLQLRWKTSRPSRRRQRGRGRLWREVSIFISLRTASEHRGCSLYELHQSRARAIYPSVCDCGGPRDSGLPDQQLLYAGLVAGQVSGEPNLQNISDMIHGKHVQKTVLLLPGAIS